MKPRGGVSNDEAFFCVEQINSDGGTGDHDNLAARSPRQRQLLRGQHLHDVLLVDRSAAPLHPLASDLPPPSMVYLDETRLGDHRFIGGPLPAERVAVVGVLDGAEKSAVVSRKLGSAHFRTRYA